MTTEISTSVPSGDTQVARVAPPESIQHGGALDLESAPTVPLAVDLDGTLVATDLLVESLFIVAKKKPATLLRMPHWLLGGLAQFKQRVAQEVVPDVETLPYNRDVLAYLREQRRQGRSVILATGADQAVARAVARHLGCFDAVFASDGVINLRDEAKRARLVAAFGVAGFDYAGDGKSDRSVWGAARKIILVHPSVRLRNRQEWAPQIERVFERDAGQASIAARALRVNHWFKNALVFLPLIADHHFFDSALLAQTFLAFAAFSLSASSIYLLNDLLDLPEDRRHPHKSQRVLASGQLTLKRALLLIPLLLFGASAAAGVLPTPFMVILGIYFLLMLTYCLKLRDVAFLDVTTLGAGYALRVLGGAAAVSLSASPWLLAFTFLFFAGLALLKRYADLVAMRTLKGNAARVHAYVAQDSRRLFIFGCGSCYTAVFLFAYHSVLDRGLHGRYELTWVVLALLLFWVTHMWLMAWRGCIHGDPVAFALSDRTSRVVGILGAITLLAAT